MKPARRAGKNEELIMDARDGGVWGSLYPAFFCLLNPIDGCIRNSAGCRSLRAGSLAEPIRFWARSGQGSLPQSSSGAGGKNGTTCLPVPPGLPQDPLFSFRHSTGTTHCDRHCRAKPILRRISMGAQAETPRQEPGRKAIAGIAAGHVRVDPCLCSRFRSAVPVRRAPTFPADVSRSLVLQVDTLALPAGRHATAMAMPFNGHRSVTHRGS